MNVNLNKEKGTAMYLKVTCLTTMYIILSVSAVTPARELSLREMKQIRGKVDQGCDCVNAEATDSKCPADNPCKDCHISYGDQTPPSCSKDNEIVDYYKGAMLYMCKSPVNQTADGICSVDGGEEKDCYKSYRCTSESSDVDFKCDENDQCYQDLESAENSELNTKGYKCRSCKLGNAESDNWYTKKADTCS